MSKLYGIDLGTTYSAIATLNDLGKPEIIPNNDGENIMASAVYNKDGKLFTGQEAKLASCDDPSNSVQFIKRKMEESDYRVTLSGNEYSPAQISSLILKKLAQDAKIQTGEDVKDVVITIPANFADTARTATIEAGKLAGLNVVGLINEPSGAACYYAINENVAGRVLIFDLGGGTFDVTIAEVAGTDVQIKASAGDRNLGGVDFDEAILLYLEDVYEKETGSKLYDKLEDRNEMLIYCELLKKSLSKKDDTSYTLKGTSGRLKGIITRDQFSQLIASYIARIEMLIETAMEETSDTIDSIDSILLVGGSSRIPAVQSMLKSMFNKEPTQVGNLDQSVALGGAIYAGLKMMETNPSQVDSNIAAGLKDVKLGEVSSHYFGTVSVGRDDILEKDILQNSIIIKKNTPIPCSKTETYYTMVEGQKQIRATVTQSSDETNDIALVTEIAEGIFELPPGLPPQAPIDITFSYDSDSVITAIFEHKESGKRLQFKGNPKTGFASKQSVNSSASLDDFTIE